MSNYPNIAYTRQSPNCTKPRNKAITKITIHHMAGNLSIESCGEVFAYTSRQASSNYAVGTDGRVALYVDEKNRSWASSSPANDHQAVTIEVANCSGEPDWRVSDLAYESLISLCHDICKRNGIERLSYTGDASGNLTLHKMFAATACPGPYLESRMQEIAGEVNRRLTAQPEPESPEEAVPEIDIDSPSPWAALELQEAVERGITDGSRPRAAASREEVAIMVLRAVKGVEE